MAGWRTTWAWIISRPLVADSVLAPFHGLAGMRERVARYRATVRTGARPGGGYHGYARIPLEEATHG